jgi:hypothetical protein
MLSVNLASVVMLSAVLQSAAILSVSKQVLVC